MSIFLTSINQIAYSTRVCLYGVGEGCLHFYNTLQTLRPDVSIVCLVDDSHKLITVNIPVIDPAELSAFDYDMVIVTSAYWVDIYNKLEAIGNIKYIIAEASLLYNNLIFSKNEITKYKNQLCKAQELLSNSTHKILYNLIVNSRLTTPENQQRLYNYFHDNRTIIGREYLEFINIDSLHTIVEGGVFDGTDTREFAKLVPEGGSVFGFDPNLTLWDNYFPTSIDKKIKLSSKALWSERANLDFFPNTNNRMGARVVVNEEVVDEVCPVQAISIDEFVLEQKISTVDFIKLDIEGSELDALRGSINTLRNHRPQMAICIYHKKEDLFQIPLFLDSILNNYKYYLGHYSPTFWDTVWYAVPDEIAYLNK